MTRVLVVKLGALGDVIMVMPALNRIRRAHPGAELSVLTSKPFAAIFEACPDVDRVDASARGGRSFEDWRLAADVLRGRYDVVYDLQGSSATRRLFLCARLLSWLGRGPLPLWSAPFPFVSAPAEDLDRSTVRAQDRHADQLDHPSLATAGTPRATPDLGWLAARTTAPEIAAPYVLLIPGASPGGGLKRWPEAHYRALAQWLRAEGRTPLVLGGPDDAELGRRVLDGIDGGVDCVGRTNLFDIAALALGAEAAVGNDTGPTHLAEAMGAPTLMLVSDTSASALRAPFGGLTALYQPRLAELPVETVVEALSGRLQGR